MKILMIDKYYFIKGGAERYFFELKKVLEKNGHTVVPFSMKHAENFSSDYENYFVENIEFNHLSPWQKIRLAPEIIGRVIYSKKAQNALARLVEAEKPDIAHLHMIDHQLSPSILRTLKDFNIPIIQTCHQYKHVCPSYRLYVMHKNEICNKCLGGKFYHAFFQRCHKKSFAASALVAIESYIHDLINIYDLVDVFHVPSRFLGNKLTEGGFDQRKIFHSFYTINLDDYPLHLDSSDYFVYYGRLSEEKGILSLLDAMKKVGEAKLYLVGDGPQRPVLEDFAGKFNLNVKFLGNQEKDNLVEIVENAKFVVVPSEWYDNSPLVIYESFSMGKPVIASTLGGMPELIDDGENGFLFEAGDSDMLAERIKTLWYDENLCLNFGKNARAKAVNQFSPDVQYEKMVNLYEKVVSEKSQIKRQP